MKKFALLALTAIMAIPVFGATEQLPPREQTLKTLIKVNDHYMRKHPDPYQGIPYYSRKKVYEANIWTRGIYFEGLMALHSIYPDNRYYDYAIEWADKHKWGMRRDDTTTRNADNYCAAQTYIDLYCLTPEPHMLTKTKGTMNMLVNTPQVDLWWRDADFVPPYKEPNGKNCYWSRGNGWVVAALVRALQDLPADDPHRADYIKDLQTMCDALVKCQRKDGFWNVSLHDESNYGGKELTGTALFVYGMAYGINNGILDRNKYLPVVTKAWNAMVNDAVHENGYLGYVQGTGKEPKDGQPVAYDSVPDFDDFGTGCFLLAGSEVYKIK